MDAIAIDPLPRSTRKRSRARHAEPARSGLLWALGISLAIHLLLGALQVGGDSFGWRAPANAVASDSTARLTARLEPAAGQALPKQNLLPARRRRPAVRQRHDTFSVTAPPTIPRAEELDPPTPKQESPAPTVELPQPSPPAVKVEPRHAARPRARCGRQELVTSATSGTEAPPPAAC